MLCTRVRVCVCVCACVCVCVSACGACVELVALVVGMHLCFGDNRGDEPAVG